MISPVKEMDELMMKNTKLEKWKLSSPCLSPCLRTQFQMSSVHIFGMQVAWKVAAVGVLLLVPHKAEWALMFVVPGRRKGEALAFQEWRCETRWDVHAGSDQRTESEVRKGWFFGHDGELFSSRLFCTAIDFMSVPISLPVGGCRCLLQQ